MLMHHKIYWCILCTDTNAMSHPADLAKSLFFYGG